MSALLEAALDYASRGWLVFPLVEDGKKPITLHGFKDATTDAGTIRAWWTADPTARIGVWLRGSGLIAVDVDVGTDPKTGLKKTGDQTFAALEAKYGPLPRTNVQRSGSGGLHVVMRDPSPGDDGWTRGRKKGGACRGNLNRAGCGRFVDVKCNGYIVLQPSGSYQWELFDPGNVAGVPDAWIALIRKPANECRTADPRIWSKSVGALSAQDDVALRKFLVDLGPRAAGNGTTYQAVLAVHHDFGLSAKDGRSYLDRWNQQCGDPHDECELDRQVAQIAGKSVSERRRGWQRGWQYAEAVDRFKERMTSLDAFAREVARAARDVARELGTTNGGAVSSPFFEPAAALMRRKSPPTPWLVHSLVTDRGTAVIATEPKSAKTWVATEMAIAVATGTAVFGEFETGEPKRVAYFYAEDVEASVRNRLRAFAAGRGLDPEACVANLSVQARGRNLDLCREDHVAHLVASCRRIGPLALLILDPLRDLHTGAEDKSDAMAPVLRAIRVIGDLLGCTVLFIHHSAKAGAESRGRSPGQRMRGSSAIHGSIDSGIYLSGLEGDGQTVFINTVRSEVKGARSAGEFELSLTIEDDANGEAMRAAWSVERATASDKADDEVSAVVLRVRHGEEAPWRDIRKKCGMDGPRADRARNRAIEQGLLEEVERQSKNARGQTRTTKVLRAVDRGAA